MRKLSVFITTYNNAATLGACLESIRWADEICVLDSFSTDETVAIAKDFGCRIQQHEFLGYGRQKELAMQMTQHDHVLLLDADEMLSLDMQQTVQDLRADDFPADGYEFPRVEQLFWRMPHEGTRKNYYLRLFAKDKAHISHMPVHAAPGVTGYVQRIEAPFFHFGEVDIHTKVAKINGYSTGLVKDKLEQGKGARPWVMVFYPPWYFLRSYLLKRGFLNGWPGFISSCTAAFYVFLKYAKLFEQQQFVKHGNSLLPPGAPQLGEPASRHQGPV
ncbi:MAG: glycosyltransferase family 2 protein [Gammaproteobacteria bacterium]|nr:MAG: glycosyltransferase family 2 protein [Gammaproteobacteria bacterium]